MNQFGKVLVPGHNSRHSGWEVGASRTSDGRLDIRLPTPGAPGSGTKPEQLFATGWSACFLSRMKIFAGKMKVVHSANLAIDASDVPTFPIHRRTAKGSC